METVEHKSEVMRWNLGSLRLTYGEGPRTSGRAHLGDGPVCSASLAFVFGTANVVHPVSLYLSHRFSFRTLGDDYHDQRGTAHTLLYMCCMALHHPSTSHCHRQMAKRSQTPILATLGARISEWGARVISNLCSDPTCCSWDQ